MLKVLSPVVSRLAPYFGVVLNLFVLSAPFLFMGDAWQAFSFLAFITSPTVLLFYGLVSLFCFLESKVSVFSSESIPESRDKQLLPYFASMSMLLVFWLSLYNLTQCQNYNMVQVVMASIITLSGIMVRVIAIKTLNQFFVSHIGLIKQHQLVTSGLYSMVRHPSELGLILICLGISLLTASVYGWCITLVLIIPLSIYRVFLEDKMIHAAFGQDFLFYQSSVPALIPNLLKGKHTCSIS